jgi:hypothetical protein
MNNGHGHITQLSVRGKVGGPLDKGRVVGGDSAEGDSVKGRHERNGRIGLDEVKADKMSEIYDNRRCHITTRKRYAHFFFCL